MLAVAPASTGVKINKAAKYPTIHRTAPTTKGCPTQKVDSAESEQSDVAEWLNRSNIPVDNQMGPTQAF